MSSFFSLLLVFTHTCVVCLSVLTSHSCLFAAHKGNMALEDWECNATNTLLPCTVKSRQSLIHKFGSHAGNVVPEPMNTAICGSGAGESSSCLDSTALWSPPPERPRSCAEWPVDGVHTIYPYPDTTIGIEAYCNMSEGGGWTVIQHRFDGTLSFYRPWSDYVAGFGDVAGEHWLGLNAIHALTLQGATELHVALTDVLADYYYATYGSFSIAGEADYFRLTISDYSGTAGDSLEYHNGHKFSTYDSDNDAQAGGQCAVTHAGAWWFNTCHMSNLNGYYTAAPIDHYAYVNWRTVHHTWASMKATSMMVRPADFIPV